MAEIINNSNITKDVYAMVDVEYIKEKPTLETVTHMMTVGMCDGKGMNIRPELQGETKKFTASSKAMTVQRDGYIMGLRGHLHDGGVSLNVKLNGSILCESKAVYGGNGEKAGNWTTISSMTMCGDKQPLAVKKGDQITVETLFDFERYPAYVNGPSLTVGDTNMTF
jgi:hypothetical protein